MNPLPSSKSKLGEDADTARPLLLNPSLSAVRSNNARFGTVYAKPHKFNAEK
jgi:hypothetical protein